MNIHVAAAIIAAFVLAILMCFQLLLAAGLPLGQAAWGGKHRVLPLKLRINSLFAVFSLGVAAWIILARAGLVAPGSEPMVVRIGTWVFAGYLTLNTAMNLASKSRIERNVMTPATLLLVVCFVLVALS